MIRCCKDCPKRTSHCHSTCPEYLEEKKHHDELKARIDEKRRVDQQLDSVAIRRVNRAKSKTFHKKW